MSELDEGSDLYRWYVTVRYNCTAPLTYCDLVKQLPVTPEGVLEIDKMEIERLAKWRNVE